MNGTNPLRTDRRMQAAFAQLGARAPDNPRRMDGLAYKNFYGLMWNEFVGWVLILPLNHGPRSNFVNCLMLSPNFY
jgi:hypothetical protein